MINWQHIDMVLLDMDGTLLDLSFDNFFWHQYLPERYALHHCLPLADAIALLQHKSETLRGSLNWYCLDHWSSSLDLDIPALKREVRHQIRFRPGTEEFLLWLKQQGKQTMLVTNAHPEALSIKAETSGLSRHVDRAVSSHELSLAKENHGFWQRLQAREGLDFQRCLFIDDSRPVLDCARQEGLPHLLQVLQPDTQLPPSERHEYIPGIIHFSEIMHP
jgi:5'-nucleotidase